MAITFVVSAPGFYSAYGLSTDTKPASPPDYVTFTETDTGNIYDSIGGVWVKKVDAAQGLCFAEIVASQTALVNVGYVTNNSSLVTLTLSPLSSFGDRIRVIGKGAGGWMIAQGPGQVIHCGSQNTTVGIAGYIASQGTFDTLELLCTTANTNWTMLTISGNLTVM